MTKQEYKQMLGTDKEIIIAHTPRAFKQAMAYAKGTNHTLNCILWNGAIFEDLIIIREYE